MNKMNYIVRWQKLINTKFKIFLKEFVYLMVKNFLDNFLTYVILSIVLFSNLFVISQMKISFSKLLRHYIRRQHFPVTAFLNFNWKENCQVRVIEHTIEAAVKSFGRQLVNTFDQMFGENRAVLEM